MKTLIRIHTQTSSLKKQKNIIHLANCNQVKIIERVKISTRKPAKMSNEELFYLKWNNFQKNVR